LPGPRREPHPQDRNVREGALRLRRHTPAVLDRDL